LIDDLCLKLGVQDKPRTYRRVARKEFSECVENEEKTCQRVKENDTKADQLPETGYTDY